jgi:hypothetical protein
VRDQPTERLVAVRLLLRGVRVPASGPPVIQLGAFDVTVIGPAKPIEWSPGSAMPGDLEGLHRASDRQAFTVAASFRIQPVVVEVRVDGGPPPSRPPPAPSSRP